MPPTNAKKTEKDPVEDTELLTGIYQEAILPTLEEQPSRPFKPWHKPRKHYIRLKQWCHEIQSLIKKLKYKNGALLTYLGLPGEDMLDIRALQGVCAEAKVKLRYLGFNSAAKSPDKPYELNLSEHEVYALDFIDPESVVLADHFEKITHERSIGLDRIRKFEPFDIINIDLCDSVASPAKKSQYFDAILKLCTLQIQSRGNKPWLMFLTTRAGRKETSNELKKRLLGCVLDNLKNNAEFKTSLEAKGFSITSITEEMEDTTMMDDGKLVELFGLAIGKWLLKIMNGQFSVRVKLLPSYRYRVATNEPDMLSLAFEFETLIKPLVDPTGVTQLPLIPTPEPLSEAAQARELATAIFGVLDVDQILWDDTGIRDKMIASCSKLMVAAHYDLESYRIWALEWSSPDKYRSATRPAQAHMQQDVQPEI